ncbi:MAG: trehalose-phosphatase [Deltaproteobacteria bacterium]|nr:trehalose-phosphatase [Deltaproteobacteria bacterium]
MCDPTLAEPPEVVQVPDFWHRFKLSKSKFLALDYDGTLAPFHPDPMQAFPLPGIPDLLKELSQRSDTALAIISGRPLRELLELLGDLAVVMIGSHGREKRNTDGSLTAMEPTGKQIAGLEAALHLAIQEGFEDNLEKKLGSIALHTRPMAAGRAAEVEKIVFEKWSVLTLQYDLECMEFNGGVEVRCTGRNKGDVLAELLDLQPLGTFSVYIGDDLTDEDGFLEISGRGIGIKVGETETPTAATGFLASCEEVRDFLRAWSLSNLTPVTPSP